MNKIVSFLFISIVSLLSFSAHSQTLSGEDLIKRDFEIFMSVDEFNAANAIGEAQKLGKLPIDYSEYLTVFERIKKGQTQMIRVIGPDQHNWFAKVNIAHRMIETEISLGKKVLSPTERAEVLKYLVGVMGSRENSAQFLAYDYILMSSPDTEKRKLVMNTASMVEEVLKNNKDDKKLIAEIRKRTQSALDSDLNAYKKSVNTKRYVFSSIIASALIAYILIDGSPSDLTTNLFLAGTAGVALIFIELVFRDNLKEVQKYYRSTSALIDLAAAEDAAIVERIQNNLEIIEKSKKKVRQYAKKVGITISECPHLLKI